MNRQTVVLLVMVLAVTSNADTISKQSTSLSPSTVTANVLSTLASEPQIPSNNKPQPFKGPTVESLPAVQPVILNNTVELKSADQISKKQETATSFNSTTTIREEIPTSVAAAVLKKNQTDSQKQQVQAVTVIDAKVSKGETTVQIIEKSEQQVSNDDKLQRQATQQKKARESLIKSNTTEMVQAQPEKTPSVTEKPKDVEKVTINIQENLNKQQKINDKKKLLESNDKKTLETPIVTTKEPKQKAEEKQKTPEQVIIVDIAKVETINKTAAQEQVDSDDQLQVQNKTQAQQETTVKTQTVKQKYQPSNEIKIIPLDNEEDQQTQEDQDEEEETEQEKTPKKEKPLPKDLEEKVQKAANAPVVEQKASPKENKTVTVKKQPAETQKPTVVLQKQTAKPQIKQEISVQTKKLEATKQKDIEQIINQQKGTSVKKQSPEQEYIPKTKQQPSKSKEDTLPTVTKPKEKIVEDDNKHAIQTVSHQKTTEVEKPVTQAPKSDMTKSSDKENKPQEHTSNLRRQQQPEKPVIEKDLNEVQVDKPQKQEEPKQKSSVQKEPSKMINHEQSLKQLLEEVKSDLSKDAKSKIIQHLQNQIKEQEESKITVLEEKPEFQKNQYLQLQSSSPHQGAKQPEKEEEVSSEEIMDTKTVIVIIILTFIISIPIVREIKSKDSQVKTSKDKMENDLKESSQTLGLEFSELDNQTGYGQPLDQEER